MSREQISENCGNRGGKIGSPLDGSQAASILVGHDNSSATTIAADFVPHIIFRAMLAFSARHSNHRILRCGCGIIGNHWAVS